MGRGYDVRRGK